MRIQEEVAGDDSIVSIECLNISLAVRDNVALDRVGIATVDKYPIMPITTAEAVRLRVTIAVVNAVA